MIAIAFEQPTETRPGPQPNRPNREYVKSVDGLLKIAEIVICFLILICASIDTWHDLGGDWVLFVSCYAMITTIILFLFHFLNIFPRHLPGIWLIIMFIYYCVYVVLFVIAAIVAALQAQYSDAIAAAAFFTFAALVLYAVDTYFMYQAWQTGQIPVAVAGPVAGPVAVPIALTTTTYTTTTTVSNYETKVPN